jgi:branched-chain amino acid transport system permease protein
MVVLGGLGSIPGVILGALMIEILPELLRGFQDYRMLFFGAAMVGMMIFRPQGLLGNARNESA